MCRDWSEQVHYISMEHVPYVTQIHCRDIMQAAFVISTIARNSLYIVELHKHLVFLITLKKCEKHSPAAHASLALL